VILHVPLQTIGDFQDVPDLFRLVCSARLRAESARDLPNQTRKNKNEISWLFVFETFEFAFDEAEVERTVTGVDQRADLVGFKVPFIITSCKGYRAS
jgi:hypothetical protein